MAPTGQVVLVVDDDRTHLYATEAVLLRNGYSPITAFSPMEALKKSRDFKGDIDLLLTDVVMPEMDGFTLAQQIFAERPQVRILVMTAHATVYSRLPLLKKPFSKDQLLEQVAKVTDSPPPLPADVSVKHSEHSLRAALTAEVDEGRRRFLESSLELLKITKDVPSGLPHPDGIFQIQRAGSELRHRFEEHQRARKKLDDHLSARKGQIDL
jgi:CheY-like chemotaxis protein